MHNSLKWLVGSALAVVLTAGISACGGTPEQGEQGKNAIEVYDKFANMAGDVRHEELVSAAKKEGKLVIYSGGATMTELLAPAFEKKYGIDVESIWPGTGEKLRQRVIQEQQANQTKNDILEADEFDMELVYSAMGIFEPYRSEIREGFPEEMIYDDWTGTYQYVLTPAWNTNKISKDELPTSFEELADPKWKDKLGVVIGDYQWYLTLHKYYTERGMSDEDFVKMFKGIVANSASTESHSGSAGRLAAGEFTLIPNEYENVVLREAAAGAPLALGPVGAPLVTFVSGAATMKNAQHPAAATLFMDWYLTEGQSLVVDDFETPANIAALGDDVPSWMHDQDLLVPVPTRDLKNIEQVRAWQDAFQNLLDGSGDVLP